MFWPQRYGEQRDEHSFGQRTPRPVWPHRPTWPQRTSTSAAKGSRRQGWSGHWPPREGQPVSGPCLSVAAGSQDQSAGERAEPGRGPPSTAEPLLYEEGIRARREEQLQLAADGRASSAGSAEEATEEPRDCSEEAGQLEAALDDRDREVFEAAQVGDALTIARWLRSVRITRSNRARAAANTAGRIAVAAIHKHVLRMLLGAQAAAVEGVYEETPTTEEPLLDEEWFRAWREKQLQLAGDGQASRSDSVEEASEEPPSSFEDAGEPETARDDHARDV